MNVLVTGGAGFIGSHLIRKVISQPEVRRLVNLDALTYAGNLANLEGIHDRHPRYVFEHADIRDAAAVRRIIQKHDISHVFHLAAESHVDRSIESAGIFVETNVLGTQHLLEACRQHWQGREDVRFLHVSTDEVYGSLEPDEAPFTEDSPLRPNSPYAASKAAADCLVRSYVQTYGFPAIITRSCNNYGPGQHEEKLIPTVLKCLKEHRPIPLYGDGGNIREWMHVTDHAESLWSAMVRGRSGEVYNIGSGEEMSNLELVRKICSIYDALSDYGIQSCQERIVYTKDRPGHDRRYAVNHLKTEKTTGWIPKTKLESGFRVLLEGVALWF